MNYETWSPVYREILDDFGFDPAGDERARDLLADLTRPFDLDRLDATGETVAVAGGGPSLVDPGAPGRATTPASERSLARERTPERERTSERERELDRAREADAVFAASTAADALRDAGVEIDCMVTDLDKNPATARTLTEEAVPVAAHAHGDNVPAVREWVPRFDAEQVLPTTQARPVAHVRNFGGFTDGDRAALLADHLGAESLVFVGWDFDDPSVTEAKARKLRWAERLLRWLEVRRDEEFGVLDGRREGIDVSGFPR